VSGHRIGPDSGYLPRGGRRRVRSSPRARDLACRGEREWTLDKLYRYGVYEMFSAIEIGWGPKSSAIMRIGRTLGLRPEAIGFIDHEPVERAEVARRSASPGCPRAETSAV
jgi:hypothetical protein